ncbi:MAG: PrsW family intramembrane metalloprotease [Anaerolineales bacterium]|jgi:RsiW-degrading membrane proteinase PrsW (M82 family)
MGLLVSFLISFGTAVVFASFLYWLDRYEKEPLLLLGGVFLWGAVVAAGSAFLINSILGEGIFLVSKSALATNLATGSIIAPLVEETLKGLAVLGVFLIFRNEFDSVLDGIIYAGVVALGFAATENTYYIYTYGYLETGWSGLVTLTFIRVFLVGWQHPFYTAFTGIGLAVARLNRNWFVKITAIFGGLGLAMFTHAFHNTVESLLRGTTGMVVGVAIDWSGWLVMFGVILWATWREERALKKFLAEEVQSGVITPAHYRTASSAWKQSFARTAAFFTGRYQKTARFYQVCGEYAHKRQQYALLGEEGGTAATIQSLRTELARLSPDVQV